MADANHIAPVRFKDFFVDTQMSNQTRRIVPHLRLTDMTPPVLYLWTKLSGRWIEAAGFEPDQRLQIEVTHKRLVITPIDEDNSTHSTKGGSPDVAPAMEPPRRKFSVIEGDAQ